jgi:eukaryotic-like serine/threonine-protein kinase
MSDAVPLEPLGPGDNLGPYRIHRRLRSPPGTELYQAGDRRNPEVLLIRIEVFVPDPEEAQFFAMRWDEIKLFTRFMHPQVLRLWDVGAEGRRYYAAMPWISARSLLACLEDDRGLPWPVDAVLSVARDIASGLGALHKWTLDGRPMKVVYRAVGPESVLIGARGGAFLRPPPLAQPLLPTRGLVIDRLPYLSPEAIRGLPLTPAADVASLGSVLYRLLTGFHPYRARSQMDSFKLAIFGQFTPLRSIRPDIPVQVERLIHLMMDHERSGRPPDGDVLAPAIESAADEAGIPIGPLAVRRARRAMSRYWE